MAENKSQLVRLLFIDERIRQGMHGGRLANCTSLAAEYEVSIKTIQRDLEFLRDQWSAPLQYDPQRRGYFYTEKKYALPALHINEGELVGLLVAQQGLTAYRNTPVHDSLVSVVRKLAASLPDKVSVDSSWLGSRISVLPAQATVIRPDVWDRVSCGLQQGRAIRITYRKPGAKAATERRIDPYHLTHYQGEWYLVGYCQHRHRILTFAVSRISEVELLGRTFSVPEDFSFEESLKTSFGIFRGEKPVTVILRFNRVVAPYILERVWHPQQEVRQHRNGTVTLRLITTDLTEIRRWVLSWGSGVRVLAPAQLAEALRDELMAALEGYGPGKGQG